MIEANPVASIPFVPIEKEAEYLELYKYKRTILPNGITVLSADIFGEDEFEGHVSLSLDTGAYKDPRGKVGMHHLLEHVSVDGSLMREAGRRGANMNASTSSEEVSLVLDGTANPDVRMYGIWPFLKGFRDMFTEPLVHNTNLQESVDTQRAIVLREIEERKEDGDRRIAKFRNSVVFGPAHPSRVNNVGGIPEDVRSISSAEIQDLANRIFITDGTFINIFTRGDTKGNDALTNEIIDLYSSFGKSELKANPVDRRLYRLKNPDFEQGNVYEMPSELNRNVRTLDLVWLFPVDRFSSLNYSLDRLAKIISPVVNDYVRNNGLSYGAYVEENTDESDINAVFRISTKLSNDPNLANSVQTDFIPKIKKMIRDLADEVMEPDKFEAYKHNALPFPRSQRNKWFFRGYSRYGRLFDADELKRRSGEISTAEVKLWREKILDVDPAVIII